MINYIYKIMNNGGGVHGTSPIAQKGGKALF